MKVYNYLGDLLFNQEINFIVNYDLDLTKYGKGIYLVKVREGDKESSSKVVVE